MIAAACYGARMSKTQDRMIAGFIAAERDYIRRELDVFFSTLPSVVEGFQLKTWRSGPEAGKPKLPPTAKGLIERGLMRLDTGGHLPRLFFTKAGLTALRAMMTDRRLTDPKKFAHIRQELGFDPVSGITRLRLTPPPGPGQRDHSLVNGVRRRCLREWIYTSGTLGEIYRNGPLDGTAPPRGD